MLLLCLLLGWLHRHHRLNNLAQYQSRYHRCYLDLGLRKVCSLYHPGYRYHHQLYRHHPQSHHLLR